MSKKANKPARPPREPRNYSFTANVVDPATGDPYEYTAKEILFITEYMSDDRHVATSAAEKAGYKSKSAGGMRVIASEVMARPRVRAAINQAFEALAMPKMEILFRLARIAGGSITDVLNDDNELDLDRAKAIGTDVLIKKIERRRDVVEVKATETTGGQDGESERLERMIIKETVKFEIHDPLRALDMLGKNARLFVDQLQTLGKDGKPADPNGPAPQVVLYLPDNGRQAEPAANKAERTSRTVKTRPAAGKQPESANKTVRPDPATPEKASRSQKPADPPKRAPKRRTM
jgi:phage terminase small subunit